jgi:glycosyltransferase involved in cell wall biosynthesis
LRILQLVSDWKWTGPAEPMLVGMAALRARGDRVDLVCPKAPEDANRSLWREASIRGLDPSHEIEPGRSALTLGDSSRIERLRGWLGSDGGAGPYDIVHCWHSRDHVLAARALRLGLRGGDTRKRARLVRFLSTTDPIRAWPWNRWLFGAGCDGLVCPSRTAVEANRPLRRGRPIRAMSGAVDLARLEVRKPPAEVRAGLGVPEGATLVGVVARMQSHRRFDLLLEALRRILPEKPNVHLVLIGRGTRADHVVSRPAVDLGVASNVVLAGYRVDDYADVLGAMDLFTYLVPGSDGTCRALLQAAALGLPLVGTSRGAIPEIIRDGETGLLVSEDAESIASAWSRLLGDPDRLRKFGERARRDAEVRFRPERLASALDAFHRELVGSH